MAQKRLTSLKENLKNILSPSFLRKLVIRVSLIAFFSLFGFQILDWFLKSFVYDALHTIKPNLWLDFIFSALSIITIIVFVYLIYETRPISKFTFEIVLYGTALYVWLRFFALKYSFLSFTFYKGLYYADYLLILFSGIIILKLVNYISPFREPNYRNDPFFTDAPILNSTEDLYHRYSFAMELAKKIQSKLESPNAKSLAIGINGQWGSGKTSFANMILSEIDVKNRVVIEFNPWRSSSPQLIIEDFFSLLSTEIRRYNPELSNNVAKYAKSLAKIDDNVVTKTIEAFSDLLNEEDANNFVYDEINKSIIESKKQIIVFIDDLDRLDIKETIEVLRLIRNTADFSNVVYLVSYDKEYVLEAVRDFNAYNYKAFLEKIFQYEFYLPSYDLGLIRNHIKKMLKAKLPESFANEIELAVDYISPSGKNFTNKTVRTFRDAVRLCNSLLFEINYVKEEVNFVDFYFLQLIKLKYSDIYRHMSENREDIFWKSGDRFRLRNVNEIGRNELGYDAQLLRSIGLKNNVDGEKQEIIFKKYLDDHFEDKIQASMLLEIINELLKGRNSNLKSASNKSNVDYKSFVFHSNFQKYFSIQLQLTDFSAKDFELYRSGDIDVYKLKLHEWIQQGKLSSVTEYLGKIVHFDNLRDWENHLFILLEIGKYRIAVGQKESVNFDQIVGILKYPKSRKAIRFFTNAEDYIGYVKRIFNNAPSPYVLESCILYSILSRYEEFVLPGQEVENYLLTYFRNYCKANTEITTEFRELHRNCVKSKSPSAYLYEAQSLFIEYYKQHLKVDELTGFIQHNRPESEYFALNVEWCKTFFPEWTDFETYLNEAQGIRENMSAYDEFVEFYTLCKGNDYNPVVFEFKVLSPSLWR